MTNETMLDSEWSAKEQLDTLKRCLAVFLDSLDEFKNLRPDRNELFHRFDRGPSRCARWMSRER
jgi:hypothetical protein